MDQRVEVTAGRRGVGVQAVAVVAATTPSGTGDRAAVRSAERAAARSAAELATAAAVDLLLGGGSDALQVDLSRRADGSPELRLDAATWESLGGPRCHVSVSHDAGVATVVVVIEAA